MSNSLIILIDTFESTLARWRAGEFGYKLPYEIDSSGNAYYLYDTVYESLQKGRISAEALTDSKRWQECNCIGKTASVSLY